MSTPIRITEYERLSLKEDEPRGKGELDPKRFGLLREFIISNKESKTAPTELMGISPKKGGGEQIYAKNYVGVISLADGTQIEILPKIYGQNHTGTDEEKREKEIVRSKEIFLKMLRTLRNFSDRTVQASDMETARLPLFEIFIRMFLDEVREIFKRGLKGGYSRVDRNERFMKGKLLAAQNIRENLVHAERFFVEYDEFDADQPENRIIRSTLEYLKPRSRDARNKQDITVFLSEMEGVNASADIAKDLEKATLSERGNAYYQTALEWSRVFLRGESFTSFAGSEYATALLFPMDLLYQSYVAKKLRGYLPDRYDVRVQERKYHIFTHPEKFLLNPDIVVRYGRNVVILDTKWKMLNADESKNYGISQGDIYQMYAYFREYEAGGEGVKAVTMLYPETKKNVMDSIVKADENGRETRKGPDFENDRLLVRVRFLNLADEEDGFDEIVREIEDDLG